MKGTVKARAREWALGQSNNGKDQIAILFDIVAGEHAGKSITWFGYFTDATTERTLESMRHCGWDGDDFVSLDGLNANEVELVLDEETYEGKTRTKVQWVNRTGRLSLKNAMDKQQQQAFAAKMRGAAIASKKKYGAQPPPTNAHADPDSHPGSGSGSFGDDDIPF